ASTYTFSVGGSTPPPPSPVLSNIVAQVTSSNLVFRFAFTTASGASYQVQSSTNLAPPVIWANEAGAISGSGSLTNVSITNVTPLIPQKFFRVLAN
ncbi:MAG: hypothetical protein H7Y43_07475, partial [Akkermansiaceae bacterium]|nr:hypothetical protein [Verrucomicrobiales bacterium]